MRDSNKGMFIDDIQIREDHPAEADEIIADMDADPKTKKGYATWPPEARSKVEVEKYLKLRAER